MIDTPEALVRLADTLMTAPAVALDTEFIWETTYYPRLGVVQVAWPGGEPDLIDATALEDLSALGSVLRAPHVVKVLHDAHQDLIILRRATGAYPCNVFDTRCAAGFVGLGATRSLGAILHNLLNVTLPKTETRSDWLQRPLTDLQERYARDDVRHLLAARTEILRRARERGHIAWLEEEMATYDDPSLYEEVDVNTCYSRIGGAGRLTMRQRTVLRELAAWREAEARLRDRPRGRIASDKALAEIARRLPRKMSRLTGIRILDRSTTSRYGAKLLDIVQGALAIAPEAKAALPERLPDNNVHAARVHLVMAYVMGRSLACGIDPALLASRKEVSAYVAGGPRRDHALSRGWRHAFLGKDLPGILDGSLEVRMDSDTMLPS